MAIMTKQGIQPRRPSLTVAKIMPRKALIMPRKSAVIKRLPQCSSFWRMRMTPFSIFLPMVGTSTGPGMMPRVMTQAIAAKTTGSVMSV